MAPKMALQNVFGTQKVDGAIFEISPTSKSRGSAPKPPCSATLYITTKQNPHNWLQWDAPHSPPKFPFAWAITKSNYLPHPWTADLPFQTDPDLVSRFATIHRANRLTHIH